MKKIVILTFHKSINYGSVLQTWALSKVLQKYKTYVLDYEPDAYKSLYAHFSLSRSFKRNINGALNFVAIHRQIKFFKKFRSLHLNCVYSCNSRTLSASILNEFDAVVTGSDQIWNVRAFDCDDAYFLPYKLNAKKIAYACSINDTDFSEKRCGDNLKEYIKDYDFISIRERSGAIKLSQFIDEGKEVYTMLDPTLLNTKDDFNEITNERIINESYIFLYNVWSGLCAVEAAQKIAKITGLPVYTAMMDSRINKIMEIKKYGVKVETRHTAPEDFLSLIKYADLVVTDSFHGTAFSLIFEKKFVCINGYNKLGELNNDERIINILEVVGLENRYISIDEINNYNFNMDIDYKIVTSKRMEEADSCISKLIGAIEGTVIS